MIRLMLRSALSQSGANKQSSHRLPGPYQLLSIPSQRGLTQEPGGLKILKHKPVDKK
jgi:hypothetical protein